MGWQQRFEKCYDRLILRAGGPGGPIISWPDRGMEGQWTWCWQDPVGETRDLSTWVGNGERIRLFALIMETGDTGSHRCEMTTLYNSETLKNWVFDTDEDNEIEQP